jgi:large subunit ribosomal protein L5
MSRLYDKYKNEIVVELQQELGIKNRMAVPRLEKIVLNMGAGDAIQNIKLLDTAKSAEPGNPSPLSSCARDSPLPAS